MDVLVVKSNKNFLDHSFGWKILVKDYLEAQDSEPSFLSSKDKRDTRLLDLYLGHIKMNTCSERETEENTRIYQWAFSCPREPD